MLINKLDLTFFSPHLYGVGFRGDYENAVEYILRHRELKEKL